MIASESRRSSRRSESAEGPRWYACYTRGRHERTVASHLDSRRVESFLPVHRLDVQWSDRRKTVGRPPFPSYVFARFQASEPPRRACTGRVIRRGGARSGRRAHDRPAATRPGGAPAFASQESLG